jgi:hypothetical protein
MASKFTAVLLLSALPILTDGAAAVGVPADPAAYTVTLQCNRAVLLKASALPAIHSWAVNLVSSSQFNSQTPDWNVPKWEVEQEYQDVLAGDHLQVDFAPIVTIKTMGGIVHVRAIVEGLDPERSDWRSKFPDHFDDSLFTLDEKGAVVGHALYSGFEVIALFRAISKALTDADACTRAKGLFVRDAHLPSAVQDFLRQNDLQN